MRYALTLIAVLSLIGCAASKTLDGWYKYDVSPAVAEQDFEECKYQAELGSADVGAGAESLGRTLVLQMLSRKRLREACMKNRGYLLEPDAEETAETELASKFNEAIWTSCLNLCGETNTPCQPDQTSLAALQKISEQSPPYFSHLDVTSDLDFIKNRQVVEGMSPCSVLAVWGDPESSSAIGDTSFYYFANGFVVTLKDNVVQRVVDSTELVVEPIKQNQ